MADARDGQRQRGDDPQNFLRCAECAEVPLCEREKNDRYENQDDGGNEITRRNAPACRCFSARHLIDDLLFDTCDLNRWDV